MAKINDLTTTVSRDMTVGGADLASQAIEVELVDEFHLCLVRVVRGPSIERLVVPKFASWPPGLLGQGTQRA